MKKSTQNHVKSYAVKYLFFIILFSAFIIFLIFLSSALTSKTQSTEMPTDTNTAPSRYPTIVIDAGHGGEDGGAIGTNGGFEKDVNLSLSLILRDILVKKGINVVMTRDEDILLYDKNSDHVGHKKEQDLLNRKKIVEEYNDPIFVSIHMNSFGSSKYKGLQVYYSKNAPSSKLLASKIQENSRAMLSPENKRTIKESDGIYLLDYNSEPL